MSAAIGSVEPPSGAVAGAPGAAPEVLRVFALLGTIGFGGPVAHMALFRRECVERRAWLAPEQFDRLLALCQFLPGPASSQMAFCLGMVRAGWRGAAAAALAFTAPAALLMFALALALPRVPGALASVALHGLQLVALAVVAHGVFALARALCPDTPRRLLACAALGAALVMPRPGLQSALVAFGALAGLLACRGVQVQRAGEIAVPYGLRTAAALGALYIGLLIGLPWALAWAGNSAPAWLRYADAFYRSGALTFGGGHVVLPMLQDAVVRPGWIAESDFLAGYGAAQAAPGPLFTFAAYLGARLPTGAALGATVVPIGSAGVSLGASAAGALLALGAILLPGYLLIGASLPAWRALAARPAAAQALAGVCAVVVGLLAAALYDPVWIAAVHAPADAAIAAGALALLMLRRISPLAAVAFCLAASALATLI